MQENRDFELAQQTNRPYLIGLNARRTKPRHLPPQSKNTDLVKQRRRNQKNARKINRRK